jgi:hypothetical protein
MINPSRARVNISAAMKKSHETRRKLQYDDNIVDEIIIQKMEYKAIASF